MKQLIESFLEYLRDERNLSPHTQRAYQGDLDRFLSFLAGEYLATPEGEIRATDVDPLTVRSFLASLARHGVGKRSQARNLSAVRVL